MKQCKIFTGILVLFAILIQSCKVTKDYARPELNLPLAFDTAASSDSVRTVPGFETFFKNKELAQLLDTVMRNNPDMKVAAAHVLAAQAISKSVKLNYLPDLNLQINSGVQRLSQNSMTGTFVNNLLFEDYTVAGNLSWEIDFWGKLKRQREEALANYLSQGEVQRAIKVQLIAQTAMAYYNLISLDEQLGIAYQVQQVMDSTLSILTTQFEVGEVNSLAVKQSEAQLAETRALIPEIKASIKAQENALHTLAGSYPGGILRSGALDEHAFDNNVHTGVPSDLLANRPDVRQAELMLKAANARVGIAKADFYPALNITAQGGLNAIKSSNWFMLPASLFGNVAAGLTQPVFNRRKIKSAHEQAVQMREAAVHGFRKSVIGAVEEVSTAMTTIEQVQLQSQEVVKRKTAMNEAIADAQVLYIHGEANYLEVLAVQQGYFQAKLAHTAVKLKEINAYITLYKSLGGN